MIIKQIDLKNFMVFKELSLDFSDKDIIGIIGNNMSGKTCVIESMYFAFTGKTRRKQTKEVIHYGEDYCSVSVTLRDEDEDIIIKRSVDRDGVGKLEVSNYEKKAEAQAEINRLLGITPDEFELTSFFKAGEINSFMEKPSSEKKDYMMKWFNRIHWKQLEQMVNTDNKTERQRLRELESKVSLLNSMATSVDDIHDRIKTLSYENSEHKKEISLRLEKVAQYQSKNNMTAAEHKALSFEYDTLKHDIKRLEEIQSDNKYANRLTQLQEQIADILNSAEYKNYDILKAQLTDMRLAVKNAITEKVTLQNRLELAKKVSRGVCPVLNSKCDKVQSSPLEINKLLQSIAKLSSIISKNESSIASVESMDSIVSNLNNMQIKESALKKDVERIADEIKALPSLKEKRQSMHAKLSQYDIGIAQCVSDLKREISSLQNNLDTNTKEIGALESKLIDMDKNKKLVEEYNIKLKESVARVENLTFLEYMFGKNGIPSLEIENGFVNVQDEANFCLTQLGQRILIELSPERELMKWEPVCLHCGFVFPKGYRKDACERCESPRMKQRKDEISFNIIEPDGNITEFDGISTGGKTLISLSIRTILSQLLRRNMNSRLDVLFLDEIDAPLDESNVIYAKEFVTKILKEIYGYKQIFWVSHNKSIKECVPFALLVTKTGTISETEWL